MESSRNSLFTRPEGIILEGGFSVRTTTKSVNMGGGIAYLLKACSTMLGLR